MNRLFIKIGLIACACLLFASALGMAADTQTLAEVRIGDSKGDWGLPNPYHHYQRGPGYVRMSWIFDTLIWKDKNGEIPALASSWSYDPATHTYTFRLNPKAKWHDGKPVTSKDVAFTFAYFKKFPYSWAPVGYVQQVETPDDATAVVTLAKPFAPFLTNIAGTMPVLPRHIWEKVTDPKSFVEPEAFIGSGPYRFKDFNKTQGSYLFEAFDDYYLGRPLAKRVIYIRTGKPLASLSTGQIDVSNIQPDMAEPLQKKGLTIISDSYGWNKKLMINHRKAPLNDKRFRQALAWAIDRQELIDKAHRGFGAPASLGLLPTDHPMYNPATPAYPHSTAKAREILESLGYVKGADGFYAKDGNPLQLETLSSSLTVGGEQTPDRDGEILKKQLEEAGIRINLVQLESSTTDARVVKWDFDLAVSGHGGLAGDPIALNDYIRPDVAPSFVNGARYGDNAELLALLEAHVKEMDPAKRKELVFRIQEIYATDLPAISLYYPDSRAAYNPAKGIRWFFTQGGISGRGVPIPQNKMALVAR